MLDILRSIRGFVNYFSEMEILGIHIDWFFHLTGVAILVFATSKFLRPRRTIQIAVAVILSKEIVDIFAKSRLEYIRPPTLDILFDLTAGFLGIALGAWVTKRYRPDWWFNK